MKLLFFISCTLIGLLQPAPGQNSLPEAFDQVLLTQFSATEPGGVVMVAKNGTVLYKKAFGMAHLELHVPVNDSMIFYIGSNTKQFTAVAILQLVETGRLSLQDSLGKFIPSAPRLVSRITVEALLSHTSGITEKNERELKALLAADQPENGVTIAVAPGTAWAYNNTNYSLLGYIIEKITGRTYADYVKENLFDVAGMKNSYVDEEVSIIRNRAAGYRNVKNRFQNSRPSSKIGASGGILSTADDLLKWNVALQSGALLKSETLRKAFQPQQVADGTLTSYGFGWHLGTLHGSPTRRHGGMVPGYTAETLYLPKEDVYIVMLTNAEFSALPIPALARVLAGIAIGKPYIFQDQPLAQTRLKQYVGLYENTFGEQLNISRQQGSLIFQRPNGAPYKLGYAGENEFFLDRNFVRIHFTPGASGRISSLVTSTVDLGPTQWFRTQKPLLKLAYARIADTLIRHYAGVYVSPGKDTLTISREGPNLYLRIGNEQLLLAAADSTRFFALKNGTSIQFTKQAVANISGLVFTQDRKRTKYLKL